MSVFGAWETKPGVRRKHDSRILFQSLSSVCNLHDRLEATPVICIVASGAVMETIIWTEVLMKNIPGKLIEEVALHPTSVIDWGQDLPPNLAIRSIFRPCNAPLKWMNTLPNTPQSMDRYDPNKRLDLIVDDGRVKRMLNLEATWFSPTKYHERCYDSVNDFNIFNNGAERVKWPNLAQTVNVTTKRLS